MSTDSAQPRFASQGAGFLVALRADRAEAMLLKPRFAAFKLGEPTRFSKRAVDAAVSMPGCVVDATGAPCAVNAYGICIPLAAFMGDIASMSDALRALSASDPQGAFDVAADAIRSVKRVPWRFDTPDAWREVAAYAADGR